MADELNIGALIEKMFSELVHTSKYVSSGKWTLINIMHMFFFTALPLETTLHIVFSVISLLMLTVMPKYKFVQSEWLNMPCALSAAALFWSALFGSQTALANSIKTA